VNQKIAFVEAETWRFPSDVRLTGDPHTVTPWDGVGVKQGNKGGDNAEGYKLFTARAGTELGARQPEARINQMDTSR
jgi:hypothetical protein